MLFSKDLSATVSGASATGLSVNLQPAFAESNITVDDYVHDTYSIPASTTNRIVDLGQIVTGTSILGVSDGPLSLILTQTTARTVDVNGAFYLDGNFTAVKVTNSDTHAHNLMLLIVGART